MASRIFSTASRPAPCHPTGKQERLPEMLHAACNTITSDW